MSRYDRFMFDNRDATSVALDNDLVDSTKEAQIAFNRRAAAGQEKDYGQYAGQVGAAQAGAFGNATAAANSSMGNILRGYNDRLMSDATARDTNAAENERQGGINNANIQGHRINAAANVVTGGQQAATAAQNKRAEIEGHYNALVAQGKITQAEATQKAYDDYQAYLRTQATLQGLMGGYRSPVGAPSAPQANAQSPNVWTNSDQAMAGLGNAGGY